MAFPSEDASADSRTIYAKPFPKLTTEEHIREVFGVYGSIRRVKLRREAATDSFRGSVYVEFSDPASARAAVASPPKQTPTAALGASTPSGRLHVMMKAEYERKRSIAGGSAGVAREGASAEGGGKTSAHKRPRRRSEGPASSSQQPPPPPPLPPPPPPPDYLLGEQHGMTSASGAEGAYPQPQHQSAGPQQQQQQQQHWQQLAEERDAALRAMEESLRKEKEENQRLYQRLAEAQQRAQDAAAREAAANQKVLSRDVEIGALKGEISMLRTQGAAQLERQSVAHKARITEMEASLQKLKDALLEKERGERELQRRAATRENGAAGSSRRGAGGAGAGNGATADGKGSGEGGLDDL